jgi:hypothetical protein
MPTDQSNKIVKSMIYGAQQRMFCHLTFIREYYDADATMRALRQSFVLTPAMDVAID